MSSVNLNANAVSSTDFSVDSSTSLQFMYAKLQLAQSQQMKTQATTVMKSIQDTQAEQKKVADMISRARELQNQAKNKGTTTTMPDDMVKFFKDRGLSYDTKGNDNNHDKDQWEYNIKSLTNYQDTLGNDTQTKMVYLQDYISQYNSYLQGASQQVNNCAQTMSTILRNS